jgi:hypothetical protein
VHRAIGPKVTLPAFGAVSYQAASNPAAIALAGHWSSHADDRQLLLKSPPAYWLDLPKSRDEFFQFVSFRRNRRFSIRVQNPDLKEDHTAWGRPICHVIAQSGISSRSP